MKYRLIAGALAGALLLAGCNAAANIAAVTAAAQQLCAFQPSAASVTTIVAAATNNADIKLTADYINQLAAGICKAAQASAASSAKKVEPADVDAGFGQVVVNGKVINIIGHFVK